jgi:drug/metabolite transporter (DMT)-like permease
MKQPSNNATATLLAGSMVVVGRWANGDSINARIVVGIFMASMGVVLISEANPELGRAFAALLVLTASFTYLPPILGKLGYKV